MLKTRPHPRNCTRKSLKYSTISTHLMLRMSTTLTPSFSVNSILKLGNFCIQNASKTNFNVLGSPASSVFLHVTLDNGMSQPSVSLDLIPVVDHTSHLWHHPHAIMLESGGPTSTYVKKFPNNLTAATRPKVWCDQDMSLLALGWDIP